MGVLAKNFNFVAMGDPPKDPSLSKLLADTTREVPFWRPLFGLSTKPCPEDNSLQMTGDIAPDCVLEVARRIIAGPWHGPWEEQARSALRLIANCCADSNVNRSIMIRRGGIEALMDKIRAGTHCDLLLPTLYNICVDYDEPALDTEGKPLTSLSQMEKGGSQDNSGPAVNAAEQKLGAYWRQGELATSIETLINTRSSAKDWLGTLADLIEMASRIAVYGIEHLGPALGGVDEDETAETRTLARIRLVHSLLIRGADIAKEDSDCCVSMCQAVLNILSQRTCHSAVICIDGGLWQLIRLPYLVDAEDDEDDETFLPYRKAMLKVIYEISGLETYSEQIDPESRLVRNCIEALAAWTESDIVNHAATLTSPQAQPRAPTPQASMCVLIINTITSIERSLQLATSTPIAYILGTLLTRSFDPDVLLPAVDLAARLALCREGQDALHNADIMLAVRKLLQPASQTDAKGTDILRETATLVRLMVKGRAEYVIDLATNAGVSIHQGDREQNPGLGGSIMTAIMSLFQGTTDARTKTEIGRLAIEILRTHFSSRPASVSVPASSPVQLSTSLLQDMTLQSKRLDDSRLLSILDNSATSSSDWSDTPPTLTVADAMAYIITHPLAQSQPPSSAGSEGHMQAEAEAWFGLGLLSTLPAARLWIMEALAQDDYQPLKRLTEIVDQHSSRDSEKGDKRAHPPLSQPHTGQGEKRDARYENVKVLVVKMGQTGHTTTSHASGSPSAAPPKLTSKLKTAQEGLEAAAADLGLDWVLV